MGTNDGNRDKKDTDQISCMALINGLPCGRAVDYFSDDGIALCRNHYDKFRRQPEILQSILSVNEARS
jgi:hypothetical protein